ncbi:MAG: hypothetical protein M3Y87_10930 [Myxococcota bacterium]|nr:hypothetical protein [Myxococcota bacterium]
MLRRLESDGLLRRSDEGWRTTRRLQGAIARAAACLATADSAPPDEGIDLRPPLALALIALYGRETSEELLADMIEALLPIEARELAPAARAGG